MTFKKGETDVPENIHGVSLYKEVEKERKRRMFPFFSNVFLIWTVLFVLVPSIQVQPPAPFNARANIRLERLIIL